MPRRVKALLPCRFGYALVMAKHMTTQEILSANLNRLMGDTITQAQVSRMAKHRGARVDQRTVGRAKNGESAIGVDALEAIAIGLGVQPWQLLLPPNVSMLPVKNNGGYMLELLSGLNEAGVRAVVAHASFLGADPQFSSELKPKSA